MATLIEMPKLSDTMTVGTLVNWLKKEGDPVTNGDMIAEVETDDLVRTTRLVFENISGAGYEEPKDLQGWLQADNRVILRIKPERVFGVIR